ncbi:peptidase family M28 protein, partial [Lentithecium fluviatile CBS 122367]
QQGTSLIDITEHPSLSDTSIQTEAVAAITYPAISHQSAVQSLLAQLSTSNMQSNIAPFTFFQNRFYTSTYGAESSKWLQETVQGIVTDSGATLATVKAFTHKFTQNSVIATIPGRSNATIVLGAHQDSVNWKDDDQNNNRAPGADDNGSGSITILEALRVLLEDPDIKAGKAPNTLEFHWYAAEEAGLLGSADVWQAYKAEGKNVKGLLQQDMTGYSKGTTDKGKPEVVGVITDYVDKGLTEFIKTVITAYCDIPYILTECGYACSDHASAYEAGYPASFIFESDFGDDSPYIHTANDTLATLDYNHMLQHAKMSLGFAYELAFAEGL